ncbi:hypothetical protein C1645_740129 [Glomus cerebriforme]|uniref:Uncharacterized protein n=1 Tax=Glomus cerebriforme TaxID=658196 RepID=A0A397STY0_9GLOM|nr:hypothetical protein C1645_740129 [Glomus cerebriforme]
MSRKELYTESKIKEFKNADFLNCIAGIIMQAKHNEMALKNSKVAQNKIEEFRKFLSELHLDEIDQKIKFLKKLENLSHANIIEKNRKILRTSEEFQDKKWFSNVTVTPAKDQEIQYDSDEGAWYGKPSKEPYKLTFVRWYDIKQLEPEVYGCSHLYYTEEYNTIPISFINQEVHIVPKVSR